MRLSLSLAITQPMSGATGPVYDPAVLALEGWWRASYTGSPWAGVASAGGSGGRDLTEATNPPATGAAVNGLTPADFDGTNDELNGAACSTYVSAASWSGWALVFIDAIDTDNANPGLNDVICGTTGTVQWGVYLRSTGPIVGMFGFDGTDNRIVTTGITTGAWQLIQFKGNGTNNLIRVNGGSWASATGGTVSSLAATMDVGTLAGAFLDGKMLEMALSQAVLSDGVFDSVLSYCRARYGLSLT